MYSIIASLLRQVIYSAHPYIHLSTGTLIAGLSLFESLPKYSFRLFVSQSRFTGDIHQLVQGPWQYPGANHANAGPEGAWTITRPLQPTAGQRSDCATTELILVPELWTHQCRHDLIGMGLVRPGRSKMPSAWTSQSRFESSCCISSPRNIQVHNTGE